MYTIFYIFITELTSQEPSKMLSAKPSIIENLQPEKSSHVSDILKEEIFSRKNCLKTVEKPPVIPRHIKQNSADSGIFSDASVDFDGKKKK